jgi:porin
MQSPTSLHSASLAACAAGLCAAGSACAQDSGPEAFTLRCHPRLAPYLASINLLPANADMPGSLFPGDPVSEANAHVKRALLEQGFTYTLFQSFGMSVTPSRVRDPAVGGLWSGQGFGFLEVFDHSRSGGSAGWVSAEINWVVGLGGSVDHEDPSARIGTVNQPQGLLSGQGFWIGELAWQQSFFDGTLVATVGMIDQQNYIDVNTFANNQFTQLMNNAFVNSEVIAAPAQGLGFNLAWQPSDWFYAVYGTFTTASTPGSAPFANLRTDDWGNQLELGLITDDFLGMGRNVFRVQPFMATVDGVTSGGFGINVEQTFGGEDGRLGWFGRYGICNPAVALNGFASQLSTGLALEAPPDGDHLMAGEADRWALGFFWGRPFQDGVHLPDEYGIELLYSLQLTPTLTIRPDLQLIWTSGDTGTSSPAAVFQLQATLVW